MAKNQLIFRTKKAVYLPIENIKGKNLLPDTSGNISLTITNFIPGTDGSVIKFIKFKADFTGQSFTYGLVLQLVLTENNTTTILYEEEANTLVIDFTRNLITEISSTVDDNNKPYLALESGQVLTLRLISFDINIIASSSTGYIQAENY